jgi:hypothetical protein
VPETRGTRWLERPGAASDTDLDDVLIGVASCAGTNPRRPKRRKAHKSLEG